MRVETAEETYRRHQQVFDLIMTGLVKVSTDLHAKPKSAGRVHRHAGTFAAIIRMHLIEWLELELPAGWVQEDIPFSGVELRGPIRIGVRRPDTEGHVPEADSERKQALFGQAPALFDALADDGQIITWQERSEHITKNGSVLSPSYVIMTWGFNSGTSMAWMKLSAPSGSTWYWRDEPIEPVEIATGVPPADEEDDDPLA